MAMPSADTDEMAGSRPGGGRRGRRDRLSWPAAAAVSISGPGPAQGVADFLGSRPPFDAVSADDLARVAALTAIEVSPRGTTIFPQGAGPVGDLRMVRASSVEVVHDGRVLDLLGPGELFGQASMISGLPTGFEARAAQNTVCYRIPGDVVRPLLPRPDVLRFVARSIVTRRALPTAPPPDDPGQRRVAALIRRPPLLCPASEPIRAAAQRMTAEGASAVLVRHGDAFGIVTDRDLRSRVIAAGLSPDEPVSAIMTEPAYTVSADRLGGDVMLDMLERNIHHIPVLSPAGQVLGVVDDGDLGPPRGACRCCCAARSAWPRPRRTWPPRRLGWAQRSSRCATRGCRPSRSRRSVRSC